jgi:hypothetical protein
MLNIIEILQKGDKIIAKINFNYFKPISKPIEYETIIYCELKTFKEICEKDYNQGYLFQYTPNGDKNEGESKLYVIDTKCNHIFKLYDEEFDNDDEIDDFEDPEDITLSTQLDNKNLEEIPLEEQNKIENSFWEEIGDINGRYTEQGGIDYRSTFNKIVDNVIFKLDIPDKNKDKILKWIYKIRTSETYVTKFKETLKERDSKRYWTLDNEIIPKLKLDLNFKNLKNQSLKKEYIKRNFNYDFIKNNEKLAYILDKTK